ncbi:MAG: hypothetical protein JNN27_17445 [Planctomycetes bacterium]|nr:hypothetical protein [Planctomycetota bacterium]
MLSSKLLISSVAVLALLGFSSAVLGSVAPQSPSKLGTSMEEIGAAVKSIQATLKTPAEISKALPEVWKAQRAVLDAKSELPKLVTDLTDEKAKAKAGLEYRTQMQDLMRAFLDVESAVLAGDAKKAEKALRAADNLKSGGHGKFRPQ